MTAERFPIEAGHIMMFARAIRDTNPVYRDVEYAASTDAGAIIAPPTFIAAAAQFDPDYPLRPKIDGPRDPNWMGSGRNPSSLSAPANDDAARDSAGDSAGGSDAKATRSLLHAEQHYEYHAPLTAGMVLMATPIDGKTWTKEGRRGGTLNFQESVIEYHDEDGNLVITARSVGVHTGRVVEQEG